jgi:hypothetical protein
MFRISKDTNTIIDVAQVDEIKPALRSSEQQSAHGHVSGADVCFQVRTRNRDHLLASGAEGVGDLGAEIVPHFDHDPVDRCVQAIHPFKWN